LAWFTYRGRVRETHATENAARANLVRAIRQELEIISEWVGKDGWNDGTLDEYKERAKSESAIKDWYLPTRIIFPFSYTTIKNIGLHPKLHELPPEVLEALALLDHSITSFFTSYEALREYVRLCPELYFSTTAQLRRERDALSRDQQTFIDEIFLRNYGLHVKRIGNARTPEKDHCLLRTYHAALQAVDKFSSSLRPRRAAISALIGDLVASLLFGVGIWVAMPVLRELSAEIRGWVNIFWALVRGLG
jgi:hypothetical protein